MVPEGSEVILSTGIKLAEKGWIPDRLIRHGIRRLQEARIAEESGNGTGVGAQHCGTGVWAIG